LEKFVVKFGQNQVNLSKIWENLDKIWAKSKSCIPKNIRSPTVLGVRNCPYQYANCYVTVCILLFFFILNWRLL